MLPVYQHSINTRVQFVPLCEFASPISESSDPDHPVICYVTLVYYQIMHRAKPSSKFGLLATDIIKRLASPIPDAFINPLELLEHPITPCIQCLPTPLFGNRIQEMCLHAVEDYICDSILEFFKSLHSRQWAIKHAKQYGCLGDPIVQNILDHLTTVVSQQMFEEKKAKVIQQAWRKVVANPYHLMGHRRLMREFDALSTLYG